MLTRIDVFLSPQGSECESSQVTHEGNLYLLEAT